MTDHDRWETLFLLGSDLEEAVIRARGKLHGDPEEARSALKLIRKKANEGLRTLDHIERADPDTEHPLSVAGPGAAVGQIVARHPDGSVAVQIGGEEAPEDSSALPGTSPDRDDT